MTMEICDLHTHALPGVDDGAQTMEYALEMLGNAVASDVTALVVTPHCNGRFGDGNFLSPELKSRFLQLKQAAQDIPVQLMLGGEARVNDQLFDNLRLGRIPTLNGSRYVLTEFSSATPAEAFIPALQGILSLGYVPLVAHPERYSAVVRTPGIVGDWLDLGCHLQLTGASITGEYGQAVCKTAAFLLRHDLVACVASDAHGDSWRSNFLLEVYDHLTVRYSRQYARCVMYDTPMAICNNEEV